MPVQTTYLYDAPKGLEGALYDLGDRDVISRAAHEIIPVGKLIVRQTDTRCRLPAASGDLAQGLVLGVALRTMEALAGVGVPALYPAAQYPINTSVAIVKRGRIWVIVEEAVVEGDQAFARYAAGTGTQLGAFRKSADTATAAAIPTAYYRSSAALGGLAILEINLP